MQIQAHPLEPFFHQAVRESYEGKLGLHDPDVIGYVSRLLCDFSEPDNLLQRHGAAGYSFQELEAKILAADPVNGTARSFDEERAVRKYVGDYALFVAGMLPEAVDSGAAELGRRPTLGELIKAGKESYYVVSQFNVFEYKKEAPLFTRLSEQFERYLLGLALVREEMGKRLALPSQVN
ncbi:MAG TPA: hypothetical protein VGG85_12280 [Terracidiphilus sp.]|jgi:hypothetical protein